MTLLTPAETAQFLKVSARTLRRLPVPRAKIGGQLRYDLADLEAWVRMQKQGMIIDVRTFADMPSSLPAPPLHSLASAVIPKQIAGSSQQREVKHRNPLFATRGNR